MFTKGFCIEEKQEIKSDIDRLTEKFGPPIGGSVTDGVVTIKFRREGRDPFFYGFNRQYCKVCNTVTTGDQCPRCTEEKFYGVP